MNRSTPGLSVTSPTPGVHSDSRPSNQWCHPAISSSVVPFSSCPQSIPASESFPMSQLFAWGGQSTEVSALASFLPKKFQGWSPSEWTGWISLQSKGLSTSFKYNLIFKISLSPFLLVLSIYPSCRTIKNWKVQHDGGWKVNSVWTMKENSIHSIVGAISCLPIVYILSFWLKDPDPIHGGSLSIPS